MKMIGGLAPFNPETSTLFLPKYVKINLGLEVGVGVWLGLIPLELEPGGADKGKANYLVIGTTFDPKMWRYLWKLDFQLEDKPGRVHAATRFLIEKNIQIVLEESLTTRLDHTHELTIIGDMRKYAGSMRSGGSTRDDNRINQLERQILEEVSKLDKPQNIESAIKNFDIVWHHLTSGERDAESVSAISKIIDLEINRVHKTEINHLKNEIEDDNELVKKIRRDSDGNLRITVTRMKSLDEMGFLKDMASKRSGMQKDSSASVRQIGKRGELTIPRDLLEEIIRHLRREQDRGRELKLERALVFADTEEKYLGILFPHPDQEIYWMDIIHSKEDIQFTEALTGYFVKMGINMLASFNRVDIESQRAHFHAFIDLTAYPELKEDKLSALKKDLRTACKSKNLPIIDIVERYYPPDPSGMLVESKRSIKDKQLYTTFDKMEEVKGFLDELGRKGFNFSEYHVSGYYLCQDPEVRKDLIRVKDRVCEILSEGNGNVESANYLLLGPAASGKSSYVESLVAEIRNKFELCAKENEFHYEPIKLAILPSQQAMSDKLEDLKFKLEQKGGIWAQTNYLLAFVDEIDSKPHETWPLETLLVPMLEWSKLYGKSIVWFFAGSPPNGLEDLKAKAKGPDFLSRINRPCLILPPLKVSDKVLIALSILAREKQEKGTVCERVELRALGYLALRFTDSRQIASEIHTALSRISRGTSRVNDDRKRVKLADFFEDDGMERELKQVPYQDIKDSSKDIEIIASTVNP